MSGRVRIALIDDHALVSAGVRTLLQSDETFEVIWTGTTVDDFLAAAPAADIVLLDLVLETGTSTPEDVEAIRARGCVVIIVTAFPTHTAVRELILAGAQTVFPKSQSPEELLAILVTATTDDDEISPLVAAAFANCDQTADIELSPQERRVLALYGSGLKIVSVARHLNVSENTVKEYLRRVRRKLADTNHHAPTQLDLNREARRLGVLPE